MLAQAALKIIQEVLVPALRREGARAARHLQEVVALMATQVTEVVVARLRLIARQAVAAVAVSVPQGDTPFTDLETTPSLMAAQAKRYLAVEGAMDTLAARVALGRVETGAAVAVAGMHTRTAGQAALAE